MAQDPRTKLATAATFPLSSRANSRAGSRERGMPKRSELKEYNYAVAGHAGTLCDADGELFIKPCTQSEVNFYESARGLHSEFAEWMPMFLGTLSLNESTTNDMIHAAIPGIVERADIPAPIKQEIQSHLHLDERPIFIPEASEISEPTTPNTPVIRAVTSDGVTWVPSKNRKIATDRALVLENTSAGFKHPNIMDAKLGVRLWGDDAPLEKRNRFDRIAAETTHKQYGFRVAGMRVYKGSAELEDLDAEDYRIYDKDWGRLTVNGDNLLESLKSFIFNETAGIDVETGKIVAGAFATDLRRVQDVLEHEESRMYSASLLFVFEGDKEALRTAIDETSASAKSQSVHEKSEDLIPIAAIPSMDPVLPLGRSNPRVDSGIGMDDMVDLEGMPMNGTKSFNIDLETASDISDESEMSTIPHIYSLKLIDFAHARWTPGQGPDENVLLGVRSLAALFEEMSH